MMSAQDAVIATNPQAVFCQVAGEAVILDVASGRYFALDAVGTAIWQSLSTPRTLTAVCDAIQAEYDVSRDRCEADVSAFLEQLAAQGLIKVEECAAG